MYRCGNKRLPMNEEESVYMELLLEDSALGEQIGIGIESVLQKLKWLT
jgi:hypothetical protein